MYKYISNQDNVLYAIKECIEKHQKTSIIDGESGSGKTYVLEQINNFFSEYQVFWLSGDAYITQRDYYPFYNLIEQQYLNNPVEMKNYLMQQQKENVAKKAGYVSKIGAEMLTAAIENIINDKKDKKSLSNCIFSQEELQVLFQMEYFCNNSENTIFLCDDVQYWDEKSLQLLYLILNHTSSDMNFFSEASFVISITKLKGVNNPTKPIYNLAANNVFSLDTVKKENYSTALKQLGLKVALNAELIVALYSITGGNLQLSRDIVDLLNESKCSLEDTIANIVTDKQLGHHFIERLNCTALGIEINETLKYASLFGSTFHYYELETVLDKKEGAIRKVIQEAEDYALIKKGSRSASFIHELIRKAYKDEILPEKESYYLKYADCLKILYPGNYQLRKDSLYCAGEFECAMETSILEYLQCLRNNQIQNYDNIFKFETTSYLSEYVESMKDAYFAFNAGKYKNCVNILDSIEDIYKPILLAEKYYLLSITLSKWLDSNSRKKARECLVPFLDKEYISNEMELWERILSAYIVACIHDNHRDEAEKNEKKLNDSIACRLEYDFDASCKLNILRRKASMIYDEKKTFDLAKKSKEFFSNNQDRILDPLQYYMSATNFMAAALKMGKTNILSEDIDKMLNMQSKYPYINFQRMEMPLNNIIIASYINGALTAGVAAQQLTSVLDTYQSEETTSTIIKSNIAVLFCIDRKYNEGIQMLEEIFIAFQKMPNLEFYYRYLITRNLCAVKFIFDKKEAISLLTELCNMPNLSNRKVFKMQSEMLLENMMKFSTITKLPDTWYLDPLRYPSEEEIPSYWKYYGKKYLFGELEFWSES